MDALRTLLETQRLFTLFLTVAFGYLVGEISIKGVSLGAGAVLFVGLAIGGFAPRAAPPALLGTLGLLLFLYGIGIQYGDQFFKGLTSIEGLKANAAAVLGVVIGGLVSVALVPLFGVKLEEALGMFAGAGTSTASLQAAMAAMKSDGPTVGYSELFFRDLSGTIIADDMLQRLITFPNVIVTGHQAFLTREAVTTICATTLQSVTQFETGKPLSNQIGAS